MRWLRWVGMMALLVGSVFALTVLKALPVDANFIPNDVMDDYAFDNAGSMTIDQINNFLNTFPNSCISLNSGFDARVPSGYSPSGGFSFGGFVSAGEVIYTAAQAYSINPQVLLTTLQKEQSLVSGGSGFCNNGDENKYAAAMGYGCPDGGTAYRWTGVSLYRRNGVEHTDTGSTCVNSAAKAGFSQQVIRGAWLLKFGEQRSEGNINWAVIKGNWNNSDDPHTCYGGPMTQGYRQRCPGDASVYYDGYTNIDGSNTHMDTGATAALYWYTPHFHGNQSFVSIFEAWFGPTTGGSFQKVISDDPNDLRQWVVYGSIKQYIPDSQTIYAWGLQNVSLVTMPASSLAAIPTGPNLDRLMRLNIDPGALYFVDGGKRYIFRRPGLYDAWNMASRTTSYVSAGLWGLPTDGGDMQFSVQDPSTQNIYMVDGGNNGQTVLRPYKDMATMSAWEGDNPSWIALDSNSGFFDQIDNAIGGQLSSTKATCSGTDFQAMGGYRFTQPGTIAGLFPGSSQSVSTATFNRLQVPAAGSISPLLQVVGTPTVYLMDGGTKHQILWPSALASWAPAGVPITQVTSSYLSAITAGASLGGFVANVSGQLYIVDNGTKTVVPSALNTAYGSISGSYNATATLMNLFPQQPNQATSFVQAIGQPSVYLLDNSSQLRHIEWADKLALWLGNQNITYFSNYIVSSIATAASPGLYVSDGSTNYVMEGGKKWTVSGTVASAWGLTNPQTYSDGTLGLFATGGAMGTSLRTGNAYVLIRDHAGFATADPNIANMWAIDSAPVHDARLAAAFMTFYPLTRFVKSSTDSRTFIVDGGNWYNLGVGPRNNLGGPNEPTMTLNPSNAPNSITDWTAYIVKSNGGTYWVIDGAGRRNFPSQMVLDHWTNFESISIPTVTDGFLNLLPYRGIVERAVKGSAPMVYSAENGTKRHILYPDTYNRYYAPYGLVTDQLLDTMPNGPPI